MVVLIHSAWENQGKFHSFVQQCLLGACEVPGPMQGTGNKALRKRQGRDFVFVSFSHEAYILKEEDAYNKTRSLI